MRARWSRWLLCGAMFTACGSDPKPGASSNEIASDPPASSGGEVPAPERVERAQPTAASGPASMTVRALIDGKEVPATVRVLDEGGAVAMESQAGSTIALRSGTHQIELQVSDAAAMADKPKQVRQVFLEPGKNTVIEAEFPWARVKLNVISGGRSIPGALVKLIRAGDVVAELKSGGEPHAITPGRYEADVMLKGTTIRVTGLHIPESATQTVPVRVKY